MKRYLRLMLLRTKLIPAKFAAVDLQAVYTFCVSISESVDCKTVVNCCLQGAKHWKRGSLCEGVRGVSPTLRFHTRPRPFVQRLHAFVWQTNAKIRLFCSLQNFRQSSHHYYMRVLPGKWPSIKFYQVSSRKVLILRFYILNPQLYWNTTQVKLHQGFTKNRIFQMTDSVAALRRSSLTHHANICDEPRFLSG